MTSDITATNSGGAGELRRAAEQYLATRRALGFALSTQGRLPSTLLSNGDKIDPCGVPALVSASVPSSSRMPALRNAFTKARTRLSPIRRRTRSMRAACEISSKQALMSPSTIHSYERDAK
jgi:hypothetical protein